MDEENNGGRTREGRKVPHKVKEKTKTEEEITEEEEENKGMKGIGTHKMKGKK